MKNTPSVDSQAYQAKKRFFNRMLTIFGRKPVLEALQDKHLTPYKLHLAESNKHSPVIEELIDLAKLRKIEILFHDKQALSRISKNARQDQGVALDIECAGFMDVEQFLASHASQFELMALDNITNPQNLGMIIRSVCASPMSGILLPEKGCAKLDALVIKASAGTMFKAKIIKCTNLADTLKLFAAKNTAIYGLDASAHQTLNTFKSATKSIFVMGNETVGLSPEIKQLCTANLRIPMQNGVESLNVSVAASLLAFRSVFHTK